MSIALTPTGRQRIVPQGFPFAPDNSASTYSGNPYSRSLRGLSLVNGLTASYLSIWRSQPWVYVGANKLSKTIANLPLDVFPQDANGERSAKVRPGDSVEGRLARLLSRPTPTTSAFDFKYGLVTELVIHGNWLGIKQGTALPLELWTVPWHLVEVVEGKSRPIDGYKVTVGSKQFRFSPEEVVHLQHYDGMSPLEPLRRTLAVEDAALRETIASFENGVRINGVYVVPAGAKLTKDDKEALRSELEAAHGGVNNAAKVPVLGGGAEFRPTQFTHQEAELIPIRKLSREEVAAALDIPPPMIGILDHGTYSNYETAQRSFYQESIAPLTVKIEEGLEVQLLSPEPEWANLDLEFNFDEVLKADFGTRTEGYTKMTRVGFSLNDIRHMENLPEVDEPLYKTAWVPQELMPTDPEALEQWAAARKMTTPPRPDMPPPPGDDDGNLDDAASVSP